MSALYTQEPERASGSRGTVRNHAKPTFNPTYENDDDFGFILFLKNTFLPIFQRIMAIAERYQLFDLLANFFGATTNRRNQSRQFKTNRDILSSIKECSHPGHKNLENAMIIREIPIHHFEIILKRDLKEEKGGEVAKANYSMNSIFLKRLLDIEVKASTDILLKLMTYQEWVEMLLKLNKSLIKNMKDLEQEVCLRMKEMKAVDKAVKEELANNRHDIEKLIKFTREGYYKGVWDMHNLRLKSFPSKKVLESE